MKNRPNQQNLVDAWNRDCPVGTRVRYWTLAREGEGRVSTTRSKAEVLSGHTAVVWIEGVAGCVALSHVKNISSETKEGPDPCKFSK
jgi:hypothetical protein